MSDIRDCASGPAEAGGRSMPSAEWAAYALSALLAVLLPMVLAPLDLPILGRTRFDLFAGTASLTLLFIGIRQWWFRRRLHWHALVPLLGFMLVAFSSLQFIAEHSVKDWDYQCYERAGQDVLLGRNPYQRGNLHSYLYPPLLAQIFGGAFALTQAAAGLTGRHPSPEAIWDLLFYCYQCGQLLMVCVLYLLSYRLATRLGLPKPCAAVLVAAVLLVNTPLHRTLKFNQINLWVLNMVVGALLLVPSRPVAAGCLAAVAAHLKLYPAVLLLPWLVARRWLAVSGFLLAAGLVTLASTAGGREWGLWSQWLGFFWAFPVGTRVRDNSLHSLSWNLLLPLKRLISLPDPSYHIVVGVLTALLTLAVLAWFGWRLALRQASGHQPEEQLLAQSLDLWAATLLVSPVVWEHHYLFALPVAIWAFALRHHRLGPLVLAVALIFWLPTFHLYLLSYHRLAGLLLLLWATRPLRPPDFVAEHGTR